MVLAGLGSRFVAFALDFTFQVAALIGFAIVVISAFHGSASTTNGLVEGGAFSLFVLVDFIGYFIFCDMLFNGRSLGKQGCRLTCRPRRAANLSASGRACCATCCASSTCSSPSPTSSGACSSSRTNRNQRLGDLIANTLVVRERVGAATTWTGASWTSPAGFGAPAWSPGPQWPLSAQPAYLPPELAHWDVSTVPEAELALARTFLANRVGLHPRGPGPARIRAGGKDMAARGGPGRAVAARVVPRGRPPRQVIPLLTSQHSHDRASTSGC